MADRSDFFAKKSAPPISVFSEADGLLTKRGGRDARAPSIGAVVYATLPAKVILSLAAILISANSYETSTNSLNSKMLLADGVLTFHRSKAQPEKIVNSAPASGSL